MSIEVIKPGLLITLVDVGLNGFRYLGIGPCGAMDHFAMSVSNYLVGNNNDAATLEMNFPAPELLFLKNNLICVTGSGLKIYLNDQVISSWKPHLVKKGSTIKFEKMESGCRAYLSVNSGWIAQDWLGSQTTDLGVRAGGFKGRMLQKGDILETNETQHHMEKNRSLPWGVSKNELDKIYSPPNQIRIIDSVEVKALSSESKERLFTTEFKITNQSNRMGYRLEGDKLFLNESLELVSSAVDYGTIQLLPDGNLIILMADHQTTGGYPRIASVVKSDLPKLSQLSPNEKINFKLITLEEAESELLAREKLLDELKQACLRQYKNYFK